MPIARSGALDGLLPAADAYGSVAQANRQIGVWIDFYNRIRPHQGLEDLTPDTVYFGAAPMKKAA